MRRQVVQQLVFLGLEVQQRAAAVDFVAGDINHQIIEAELLRRRQGRGGRRRLARRELLAEQPHPAEQRLHPRQQLAHTEGLGEVIIRAHLQPHHLVNLIGAGGEHQHRDVLLLAQAPAHLEAIQPRQHHIQQNEVWMLRLGQFQRVDAIARREHRIPLAAEVVFQRLAQREFIFDNENFFWHDSV